MTLLDAPTRSALDAATSDAIDSACARVAPAWPLDRLIAVNPYQGFAELPIEVAAGQLAALAGSPLTAPREWLREATGQGVFSDVHLHRVHTADPTGPTVAAMRKALDEPAEAPTRYRLVTDLVDEVRGTARQMAWVDFVVQHITEACGALRGAGQASWGPAADQGLYSLWRELSAADGGVRMLMGLRGFKAFVRELPEDPRALIALAMAELRVAPEQRGDYSTALLLSVSGWAAAFAHDRFEARLGGGDDDGIVELLAVRLAWELALLRLSGAADLEARWDRARDEWTGLAERAQRAQRVDWALQRAVERAYHEELSSALAGPREAHGAPPRAQVAFCIDVRSEVLRRHLEALRPDTETIGFAGFFGLPVEYVAPSGARRPQLPGPLAPSLEVHDVGGTGAERERRAALLTAWRRFTKTASSAFTMVESTGLGFVAALIRSGFTPGPGTIDPLRRDLADPERDPEFDPPPSARPRLAIQGEPDAEQTLVDLAEGVLRGMGLTSRFAPLVAFVGHGARVTNNPQAAGLACGACGGQSGEVGARALAALLEDPVVRKGLVGRGIRIPEGTHFIAGLHETVTDEVTLFDRDLTPSSHQRRVRQLQDQLLGAGALARRERAPRLGLEEVADDYDALRSAMRRRAADWSEVRPEWGLARNAAFVVAPRERTRGRNLGGRSFLHDYRWQDDEGFGVLEQILTAPMVVTSWINLQYHASAVDPVRFGSGDKVLHNVLGATVGVLEGAGGDLRVGLSRQSVHDGRSLVHDPLRLTVCVEAPEEAIDGILAAHDHVRDLAIGGWIHLVRIDGDTGALTRRAPEGWVPLV